MTDTDIASSGRRGFIAAALGTALAASLDARAAPLLGVPGTARLAAANAWLEIDLDVFDANLRRVRALAGDAQLCAVLKADAYGTGIDRVIPRLVAAGVGCVGIASTEEARMVRACGYRGRVLRVRAATLGEVEAAWPHRVEELVGNLAVAQTLAALARRRRRALPVHLALNSAGMGRNGLELATGQGRHDAVALVAAEGLRVVGLMTHFPSEAPADVRAGVDTFREQADWLFANTALHRGDVQLHAANSFALQHVPESRLDMVRPGGALYGYGGTPKPPFAHVAAFKTRVASVQAFPAGDTVSYDRTFTLRRDSLLANLPVGYSDGYRRAYSNKGSVLVRGRRAPVLGRVTMNTTMVDVTDIPGVQAGDEVVLFGRQGGEQITQTEIEAWTGVILADQYSVWGALNPKFPRTR